LLNSDVFILTSRFEGHPMALIEALSYGLPCLITRGTNMLEEVQDANAGWVCEISCNSIKDGIIQMLNDVDRLQNKSNNAITLSSKYDWKLIAKSLHKQLFESIINK
jgi:glycosyltransferase involved in cell wall biosynthesis